jgi:cytochrome c oxidase assembly factor CtaG
MHASLTATRWATEPALVAPVLAAGVVYARGVMRLHVRHRDEIACFALGWIALALSLLSPLHAASEEIFSAHMAQHELLMVVAAPLIVLGRPSIAMLMSLPRGARRAIGRVMRIKVRPFDAWLAHAIVLWVWHLPALFEATLTSDRMHALQHISFVGSALVFWSAVLRPRRRASLGLSIVSLFTTAVHTSVLGALMTFARLPWYPAYAHSAALWGLTPAEDQQLAGLIMWVPASAAYLIAAMIIVRRWLASSALSSSRSDARVAA